MSQERVFCCCLLLRDHFGSVVETVGKLLMNSGSATVHEIVNKTGISSQQVKNVLRSMVQHYMVYASKNKRGFVEYSASVRNILNRARVPYYINAARLLYGDIGEVVVDALLHHGRSQMLDLIDGVIEKIKSLHPDGEMFTRSQIHEIFSNLVKTNFIQRCANVSEESDVIPVFNDDTRALHTVPSVEFEVNRKRKREETENAQPSKKMKTESGEAVDADVPFWRINYNRFHLWLRDRDIYNAILLKLDQNHAEIVATILRLSEVKTEESAPDSTPVSANEIFQGLPTQFSINRQLLDQYLTVLVEDSSDFVSKVGDSGGGMYSINLKKAVTRLATHHIESVVRETFGSKCLRIFRLLQKKMHLEQQQIEQFAMIPAKEAKEMLYNMFGTSFVTVTELAKTPDHAPARTFYLFSVALERISRELLNKNYKTLGNLICKRENLLHENRRLLEKQQRIEAIAAAIEQTDPSQKEEIEEMITPAERTLLNKFKQQQNKLEHSELQLDGTIFILESYLKYVQMK